MDRLSRLIDRLVPPTDGSQKGDIREAVRLSVGLVLLLTFAKPLLDEALGLVGAAFTLAMAWQLFVPLDRLDRARINPARFGIHAHGLLGVPLRKLQYRLALRARRHRGGLARRLTHFLAPYTRFAKWNGRGLLKDLGLVAAICLVTFPPFVFGYIEWNRFWAQRSGHDITVAFQLMPNAVRFAFIHLTVVAIPEELFYRGYVHTLLTRAWPPRWTLFGASVGKAVIVGSALFALGHFGGEWNPARLSPFFPAIAFCALRSVSGSILAAVLFHGLCNFLGELMRVSVHVG